MEEAAAYTFFGMKSFVSVGERSDVTGRVDMNTRQRNCSQITITLTTSDPALKCARGHFPLQHNWITNECYMLDYRPADPRSSSAPWAGPPSCTAVRVAPGPVELTVTVHKGGKVLTTISQQVAVMAKPGPPPFVRILVSPKEAVADAQGSAKFQVTVTGLEDCSIATLEVEAPAGQFEGGGSCQGPSDLVQGANGTCTTTEPITCGIDLAAWPDDVTDETPWSGRAVKFNVIPVTDEDPRVVYGQGGDFPFPRTWAHLRDPPEGTNPGVPPVKQVDALVMATPPTADVTSVPATAAPLSPTSDKVRCQLLSPMCQQRSVSCRYSEGNPTPMLHYLMCSGLSSLRQPDSSANSACCCLVLLPRLHGHRLSAFTTPIMS